MTYWSRPISLLQPASGFTQERTGVSRPRCGFTLVELLVVIAIIGVLVALLLPAIQAAREAARRAQCQSNIKNVALAVLNYESAKKILPMGMTFEPTQANRSDIQHLGMFGPNWMIEILPYLEEQPTYDAFDFTQPINDTRTTPDNVNRVARGTLISVLLCPSDEGNRVPYSGAIAAHGDNWGRTNYAANAGRSDIFGDGTTHNTPHRMTGADSLGWRDDCSRGLMGPNVSVPLRRITDGTSKTIMVGEIRAGVNERDSRGVWAMGHAGPSLLAGFGSGGDDDGPNACNAKADDVYLGGGCESPEIKDYLQSICMTCDSGGDYFAQQTVRSAHVGGAFAAMCDGSVQFIRDDVETNGSFGQCCTPWDYMISSGDSEGLGPYNGLRRGGCINF